MSTNFGLAGIPGTRLKVPVWGGGVVGWGGSHTHYRITPVQDLNLRLGMDCYKIVGLSIYPK